MLPGVQNIVDECGAIYRKCFVKDLIRWDSCPTV